MKFEKGGGGINIVFGQLYTPLLFMFETVKSGNTVSDINTGTVITLQNFQSAHVLLIFEDNVFL
jgi:hypothetical protein